MDHLKTLKLLNFALGGYTAIVGALFLAMFVLPGLWLWWEEGELPGLLFVAVGLLAFVLLGLVSASHVVVGYLVGSGRGRMFQTLLAATQLMSFPTGTAYAVYAFYVCWVDEPSARRFTSAMKSPVV
jgi:hypothetical protein